ncbi:MAG TPA: AMP-binding protein [Ktedonobacterales bacterium]|nr:AMP-binding protein [Ktedonobacterales bacterium]
MIFRSPYLDVTIPDIPLTPFLLRHAERLAEKPALIDGASGRRYTYGELAATVGRLAGNLARRGFQKGDVLALYCPNSPEYIITLLAVWSLGGRSMTINPLYTAGELAYQLGDAHARYLLTAPEMAERAREGAAGTGVETIFTLGGAAEGTVPFEPLLTEEAQPPAVAINPGEDVAVLLYSSGTTGLPKGVMLTHRNVVANICQAQPLMRVGEDDLLIDALPFFHIAAWVVFFHMGLALGGTIVTLPRFDLEQFLRTMQDYRVTRTLLVPPIVLALAKQAIVDNYDLSHFKAFLVGAAPLAESVARSCSERIGCLVQQVYGLTETSPLTHMNPEDREKMKLASVGTCVPNTECKIIDPATGAELGLHEPGELWVRGPQIMRGYLNRPDATAATIDAEGWMRTGDIGYADEDGHFYIVDRVKELIKYKAFQVAPAELEALLLAHPAVADAAVIPSPDEEAGEVPKAFVVLKPNATATSDELMAYVAERVAPHKKIRRLEFIDQVPKTASGKLLRRVLVERERAAVQARAPGS